MCSVYLKDSEKVVSISSEHLEPVTPTKSNKVWPPPPSCPLWDTDCPLGAAAGFSPHLPAPSAAPWEPTTPHEGSCGISGALPPSLKTHCFPHADLTPSRLLLLGFDFPAPPGGGPHPLVPSQPPLGALHEPPAPRSRPR